VSESKWWDLSWNPVTGCTMVSAGCAHCYAKSMHDRFFNKYPFEKVEIHPERLSKIDRTKPKVIFVDSASDLFHEAVPFEFITEVFSVMQRNPLHTFVVLTKRAKRMAEYFKWARENNPEWRIFYPLENVWLGVSAENQEMADERIPLLIQAPAKHRFVSVEPMLGPVDLRKIKGEFVTYNLVDRSRFDYGSDGMGVGAPMPKVIEGIVGGGETGSGARVMHLMDARSLRDQCVAAGIDFFFKQWGEWVPDMINDSVMVRSRMTGIGRKLDGREWNDLPWKKVVEKPKASTEVQLSALEGLPGYATNAMEVK